MDKQIYNGNLIVWQKSGIQKCFKPLH